MLVPTTPRLAPVAVLAASALVLGACGGGSATDPVSADVVEANVSDQVDVESPTSTGDDTVAEDTAPEPAPVATDPAPVTTEPMADVDASCLVGDWVITQDELNGYFATLSEALAPEGSPVVIDVVGETLLSFTESEYEYTADFDLTIEVVGTTGTGGSAGSVSGDWEVEGDQIVTSPGSSSIEVVIDVAGVIVDGAELADGLLTSAPIAAASFDCDGPTVDFQADATGDIRHTVLLTPA